MANVVTGRYTAQADGSLVVFLIGPDGAGARGHHAAVLPGSGPGHIAARVGFSEMHVSRLHAGPWPAWALSWWNPD
jgi:hypothetical protein